MTANDSLATVIEDLRIYAHFLQDQKLVFFAPARRSLPTAPPVFPVETKVAKATAATNASSPSVTTAAPVDPGLRSPVESRVKTPALPKPAAAAAAIARPAPPPNASSLPLPAPMPIEAREEALRRLAEDTAACRQCVLVQSRRQVVPGEGTPMAELMFIGEGPGADEDRMGRPFVGLAGEKLNEMIKYLGLKREEVYICNIVKCRPPGNRVPVGEEAAACRRYLEAQIEIVQPKVICLLGSTPLKYVTGNMMAAITRERGRWIAYRGIPVLPTFHPAYLLRQYTPENRRHMASDIDAIRDRLLEPGCKVAARKK